MIEDIDIVPAEVDDAGELLTLQRAAYVTEGQLHGTPFLPPLTETLDELRAVFETQLVFKAVLGQRLVGSIRMRVDGDVGHVGRIAVVPDHQGRGIGTRLIGHVEHRAPVEVRRFELFTGPNSLANIALYERLGYVRFEPSQVEPNLVYLAKRRADEHLYG